jgi:MraZ protein
VKTSFKGNKTQRMDGKGRLIIPAQFREVLREGGGAKTPEQTQLVINYGDYLPTGQLRIFSLDGFAEVDQMIRSLPAASKDRRHLNYVYMTQSEDFTADKEGRVILGAELREKLGIEEGEVRFLGVGDYVELWSERAFRSGKGPEVGTWLAGFEPGEDPLAIVAERMAAQRNLSAATG